MGTERSSLAHAKEMRDVLSESLEELLKFNQAQAPLESDNSGYWPFLAKPH